VTLLSAPISRDVEYSSLEPDLARLLSPTVSLLEIHIPFIRRFPGPWEREHRSLVEVYLDVVGVTSLLAASARLEPEELVLTINNKVTGTHIDVPYFFRAALVMLKSSTCRSISSLMPSTHYPSRALSPASAT
jgi:hypothetical protein